MSPLHNVQKEIKVKNIYVKRQKYKGIINLNIR